MLVSSVDDNKDLWLIYQFCSGRTMGEHLFTVKGEFYNSERIYLVQQGSLYHALRNNITLLRSFIAKMVHALRLLDRFSIVHADLKPDNIIIDYDEGL